MSEAAGPTFIGSGRDFAPATLVPLGVLFDGTVSFRPAGRFLQDRIKIESAELKTYSPYFDADLTDFSLYIR